jgi:diadenosine tetraphosphate (Ap4A) HIT family hydrolase
LENSIQAAIKARNIFNKINLHKNFHEMFGEVTGFNIGMNIGESAGQTVFHAHIHLIPRRDGDCDNPRGGIRGVIDGKRCY